MRIVHLNTSLNYSSAPYKLHQVLLNCGYKSEIITLIPSDIPYVEKANKTLFFKIKRRLNRVHYLLASMKYQINGLDCFPVGLDITKDKRIQEADVVWLHWINGDYQSPKTIKKLLDTKKVVLWTCHDNYPFTGGCHVRLGCQNYQKGCGYCKYLNSKNQSDPTYKLVKEKSRLLSCNNLVITAPSSWMYSNVERSVVFHQNKKYLIPNIIDTDFFVNKLKHATRKKYGLQDDTFIILVSIKSDETISHNGMKYLWDTINGLEKCMKRDQVEIVSFGSERITNLSNFKIINLGYISNQSQLSDIYSLADVFLVTSLEDSFNMTVAEAMSCQTPVVAFNNGGIADIIDHKKNGYLANYLDVNDMIDGIMWVKKQDRHMLGVSARDKIENAFSEQTVMKMITQMFDEIVV